MSKNVHKAVSRAQLVKTLALGLKWNVRSEGMDTKDRHANEHKVFAPKPPPTRVVTLKDGTSRTVSHAHIVSLADVM